MKKILLVFLFIGLVSASNAQDRVAIGLKAGFNSTKIDLSDIPSGTDIKNEARNGFLFGGYGRLKLVGALSFQPELYYAKKQTEYRFEEASGSNRIISGESTINSFDIPLLANLQLIDLKVAQIYGLAGPVASFMSSSDIKNLETSNWTFQAGIGAQVWKFSADVRYEWGMKDITKGDIGQKTDVLTFTVGYRLFGL